MTLIQVDPDPIPDPELYADNSTNYTATKPSKSVVADVRGESDGGAKPNPSSVPWPGSNFIIRSVSSGHVITLVDGQVILAPLGGRGSIHWTCVETKGWLGFQNQVSGRFLGHDKNGNLRCSANRHQLWENFCVRMRPDGGYVLLLTHWERLWHVGIKVDQGVEKLAKIGDGGSAGVSWEFIKV